ncbi:MAG TPA: hypothetical protein DEP48_09850 [Persephonella sp.]|uniref:Putative lipoprotein n=1 Tax=Persephonella marina (strain DSM 14350 / EX-H1) TaxID=123214 RepID=C0QSR6_PERMH|nr:MULTISPECIES: LPP20 family lipoprotein [Persephonella]ACO03944.1 putative lipoprotein [Persephonella marina EX-H1]HCB70650.1 hypothetical protein [Persephonella sp.]
MRRTFILILLIIVSSCSLPSKESSEKPEWIYKSYYQKGKICGVGYSAMHVRGFAYQRATAIARAIDEIARQMGVRVDSSVEHFLRGTRGGTVSGLQLYTVQTTSGRVIKAKIIDSYYDEGSREFFVLMCTE